MKELGFGFMRLPLTNDEIDEAQVCEMVDTFINNGFVYFDTAYMYHGGKSELYLKKSLTQRYDRDKFILADKLPMSMLKEKSDMEKIFSHQLEKCGVEYFDYYLLHCLNKNNYATAKKYNTFDFVSQKKKEGKIKKIGFSFHDTAKLLDEILTENPVVEFVQLQLNYLDWEDNKIQSRLCYEVARKHGVDIIVMEPVKGGALANVPKEVETMFKSYDENMSVASWAIRYVSSLDGVFMVLSGMSNLEQLNDNISYMKQLKKLNKEEKQMCKKACDIIKLKSIIPCTSCRYCIDNCPMDIAIPEYFNLYNENMNAETLKKEAYDVLAQTHGKASSCVKCKKCENICPQHIKVVTELEKVKRVFE